MCSFSVFPEGTWRFSAPHAPLTSRNSTGGRVPGAYRRVPRTHPRTCPVPRVPPVPHVPRAPASTDGCVTHPPPPGAWKVQQLPHTLSPAHWVGTVHTSHHVPCAYPPPRLHAARVPRGHAGKEQVGTGLNDASLGAPCASRAPERGSSPARPKVPPNMRTSAPFLSPNAPRPHPRREGTRRGTH